MQWNRIYLVVLCLLGFLWCQETESSASPKFQAKEVDQVADLEFSQLGLRSINDWSLTDVSLVSDVDGNLHAIERNSGSLLWSLPIEDPLVKVSSYLSLEEQRRQQVDVLWLVEPFGEGYLYYFTFTHGLIKVPTSIRDLVLGSPFCLSGDDKIYTGSRKTSLYAVNVHTGRILSTFGGEENCPNPFLYSTISNFNHEDIILLGKTTYELTIHSKENSSAVWNVTYSQWGPNNLDADLALQNQQSMDKLYINPFYEKSLLAINKDLGTPVWLSKLPLQGVNVFDVFSLSGPKKSFLALPHPLAHLNELQRQVSEGSPARDLCFVGRASNKDEWFVMSFEKYPSLVRSAPLSNYEVALSKMKKENYYSALKDARLDSTGDIESLISGTHKVSYLPALRKFGLSSRVKSISKSNGNDGIISSGEASVPEIIEGLRLPSSDVLSKTSNLENSDLILYDPLMAKKEIVATPQGSSKLSWYSSMLNFKKFLLDAVIFCPLVALFLLVRKKEKIVRAKTGLFSFLGLSSLPFNFLKEKKIGISGGFRQKEWYQNATSSEQDDLQYPIADDSQMQNTHVEDGMSSIHDKVESNDIYISESGKVNDFLKNTNVNPTDGVNGDLATKKKRKRGSRGGKRSGRGKRTNQTHTNSEELEVIGETDDALKENTLSMSSGSDSWRKVEVDLKLAITDTVLGYGSHGTVVYKGFFEGRPVAVKRLLLDFYEIANHEVRLLQESDDHPNVIRYFFSQRSDSDKFLYIALELCHCSLEKLVDDEKLYSNILRLLNYSLSTLLYQIAYGLHYLHTLKIVHRDIKPQNILIGSTKKHSNGSVSDKVRLLISDFGLCKKLDADESSFGATTNAFLGTSGWRAPELLMRKNLHELSPRVLSLNKDNEKMKITKSIDIFALGCVFFYILTNGSHPFGDKYLREANILNNKFDLSLLKLNCPTEHAEVSHLISSMISHDFRERPDTSTILKHPYFWSFSKKLEFLLKVSDRFEVERRDPPSELLVKLEQTGKRIHKGNWHKRFNNEFLEHLTTHRKYQPDKLMDLLRALRNKYHHFNDMPPSLQEKMRPLPQGFYEYFALKFPSLLIEVYFVVQENLLQEHLFDEFFN